MSVTIKDIAREIGISASAVSKAINGYSDISEETRQRVLEAVRRMGYTPNILARGLIRRQTNTIGLFVLSRSNKGFSHSFSSEVIAGIMDCAGVRGHELLLYSTNGPTSGKKVSYRGLCHERQVDGAIFMGLRTDDPGIEELKTVDFPVATLDVPIRGGKAICVGGDNVEGAYMATSHLISIGHRRIAYINGHAQAIVSQERLTGYLRALSDNRIPEDSSLVVEGAFTEESGAEAMNRLLGLPNPPTAVFAACDSMAIGAMGVAAMRNLKVPDDLAVVGYDDIPLAAVAEVPLTTIRQDGYAIGYKAAEVVINDIERGSTAARRVLMGVELVVRESCGARKKGLYRGNKGTKQRV